MLVVALQGELAAARERIAELQAQLGRNSKNRRRTHPCNAARSSSVNTNSAFGRPRFPGRSHSGDSFDNQEVLLVSASHGDTGDGVDPTPSGPELRGPRSWSSARRRPWKRCTGAASGLPTEAIDDLIVTTTPEPQAGPSRYAM